MSPKQRKTKRWGEEDQSPAKKGRDLLEGHTDALISEIADGVDKEIMKMNPQIPYKLNQICVDVKIVDIRPESERCIGFVYAKRDQNGVVIKERVAKYGKVVLLEPVWGEKINWMTVSDFDGFIEARKKCFTL